MDPMSKEPHSRVELARASTGAHGPTGEGRRSLTSSAKRRGMDRGGTGSVSTPEGWLGTLQHKNGERVLAKMLVTRERRATAPPHRLGGQETTDHAGRSHSRGGLLWPSTATTWEEPGTPPRGHSLSWRLTWTPGGLDRPFKEMPRISGYSFSDCRMSLQYTWDAGDNSGTGRGGLARGTCSTASAAAQTALPRKSGGRSPRVSPSVRPLFSPVGGWRHQGACGYPPLGSGGRGENKTVRNPRYDLRRRG